MRGGFPRWMVLVLVQVGSDDEESHASEKDSPVAGIQAASGLANCPWGSGEISVKVLKAP